MSSGSKHTHELFYLRVLKKINKEFDFTFNIIRDSLCKVFILTSLVSASLFLSAGKG